MPDESPFDIELTRVFDAPRERVYRAFTVPNEFARWYGPVGFPASRDTLHVHANPHDCTGKPFIP
jgi:uncharacterized protein YndB with AHSA1/START domain